MVERTIQFDDCLGVEARKEWDVYWAASAHSAPRQNASYGDVESSNNRRAVYVTGRKNGELAFLGLYGLTPFLWRNTYSEAVCLRGPVFDDIEFGKWCLAEVLKFFSNKRVGQVRIGPRWIFPEAEEVESMLFDLGFKVFERHNPLGRRSTGLVSIGRDDEQLLASFSGYTRRQVRFARRLGIKIIEATSEQQAEEFFVNIKKMYNKKALGNISRRDFFPVFDQVLKNRQVGVLLNAYSDSAYLGGLYLTRDGHAVYAYQLVVTDQANQKHPTLRLAPALFFHGMRWGREHGCSVMDLEGYSADIKGAGQLALVYLYKQGFRPSEVKSLGQYVAVIRPTIRSIYKLGRTWPALMQKPRRAIARLKAFYKKMRTVG